MISCVPTVGSTWRSRTRFVREQLRIAIDEPYRTLLGHLRHEIGHYYFYRLVGTSVDYLPRLGTLFGDPDTDYRQALDRHYRQGAPPGWKKDYVSSYATMHPAEDWAETFAHYLHIRDTLDTAAAFGFGPLPRHLRASDAGAQRHPHHHPRDGRAHAPRTRDRRRSEAALAPHPGGGDPARRRGGHRPPHHDGHRRRRGKK